MKTILWSWLVMVAAASAELVFTKTLTEIHAPVDASKVTASFEFTNRGDQPVTIRKYDSGCSCMGLRVKDGKLRYEPGESGLLLADFEIGNFAGSVDKIVSLWLDDDPSDEPSIKLTVRVHIPVLVALDPKTIEWSLDGDAGAKSIHVTMNDTRPTRITAVTSSSPLFEPQFKTIEEGKRYEIIVKPTGVDRPGLGILRIETDSTSDKQRLQQAFAVIRKPLPVNTAAKP